MTFWIILAIAGFLTAISLRYRNLLFSLAGSLGWLALWMYNFSYPPTNITVGSTLHEFLVYTFILMAIGTMLVYFWNRSRGYTGYPPSVKDNADAVVRGGMANRGIMGMNYYEYRTYLRNRLRRRAR